MAGRIVFVLALWISVIAGAILSFMFQGIRRDKMFWSGIDPLTGERTGGSRWDGWAVFGTHFSDSMFYGMIVGVFVLLIGATFLVGTTKRDPQSGAH